METKKTSRDNEMQRLHKKRLKWDRWARFEPWGLFCFGLFLMGFFLPVFIGKWLGLEPTMPEGQIEGVAILWMIIWVWIGGLLLSCMTNIPSMMERYYLKREQKLMRGEK